MHGQRSTQLVVKYLSITVLPVGKNINVKMKNENLTSINSGINSLKIEWIFFFYNLHNFEIAMYILCRYILLLYIVITFCQLIINMVLTFDNYCWPMVQWTIYVAIG